jgi:hypothetical protein
MNIKIPSVQSIIAYLSIVMGVLTTQLSAIHLPTAASVILGVFGVLLHPQTSIVVPSPSETPKDPPAA